MTDAIASRHRTVSRRASSGRLVERSLLWVSLLSAAWLMMLLERKRDTAPQSLQSKNETETARTIVNIITTLSRTCFRAGEIGAKIYSCRKCKYRNGFDFKLVSGVDKKCYQTKPVVLMLLLAIVAFVVVVVVVHNNGCDAARREPFLKKKKKKTGNTKRSEFTKGI